MSSMLVVLSPSSSSREGARSASPTITGGDGWSDCGEGTTSNSLSATPAIVKAININTDSDAAPIRFECSWNNKRQHESDMSKKNIFTITLL